jgi:hypothetical protein
MTVLAALLAISQSFSDGEFFLKIVSAISVAGNVVLAWAVLTGRSQKRTIDPNPFPTKEVHDFVSKPDFEKHTDDIWEVVNGIRRDITNIKENVAVVRAVREENGTRLEVLSQSVTNLMQRVGELIGQVERGTHAKR